MSDLIHSLPESLMTYVSIYLMPSDWSSMGNLNLTVAFERNHFWVGLYRYKFLFVNEESKKKKCQKSIHSYQKNSRITRSDSNPRLAFFNALRNRIYAFDQRAHMMVTCLRKFDSPRSLDALFLPEFPINRLFVPCSDSTILCTAVRLNRWRCVQYLVLHRGADLNVQDHSGMNPLIIASWNGNLLGVKKLLKLAECAVSRSIDSITNIRMRKSNDARHMVMHVEEKCPLSPPIFDCQNILSSSSIASSQSIPSICSASPQYAAPSSSSTSSTSNLREDQLSSSPGHRISHICTISPCKSRELLSNNLQSENVEIIPGINPYHLNLDLVGTPTMTSVCGGRGPYTAEEWARRKSLVCPEKTEFLSIVQILARNRIAQNNCHLLITKK